MNKLTVILFFFVILSLTSYGRTENADSIAVKNLEFRLKQLDDQFKEVRRDELNYKIEKDLVKETYRNNYEIISLFITIVLVIIAVLGYLGIRDINSIKKEYAKELISLKQFRHDTALKYDKLQKKIEKYETQLHDIFETNEVQNMNIKVLQLKDKIDFFFKDELYASALEFCISALKFAPEDNKLLHRKAMIYARLRKYKKSITTYLKILEIDNNNQAAIVNLTEVYLLSNHKKEYNDMLLKYSALFNEKFNGKLMKIFSIVTTYQDKKIDELKEIALTNIDLADLQTKSKRIDWEFKDLLIYLVNEPDSKEKIITQNLVLYLDGQLTGNDFLAIPIVCSELNINRL